MGLPRFPQDAKEAGVMAAMISRIARPVFVLSAILFAWACSKQEASSSAPAPVADEPGTTRVVANEKGFSPNSIQLAKGESATLIFTRTTDSTCARDIVFPELDINKPLPLNEPVKLEIPTGEARSLTFQCGMGMYKSSVVIQ